VIKEDLSENNGPSILNLAEIGLIPAEPEILSWFPSSEFISKTDDIRPPYFAGMLPL